MSSSDGALSPKAEGTPRKGRKTIWRVLGWLVATLLLIGIIAAAYIWQNRYAFLEDTLEDILAQQGLEAQLSIRDIRKKSARLEEISIAANGQTVFSADTLKIEYDWREALKGRMNRIELNGAELDITVDKEGKIIDGWLPTSNTESELVLPPQGLHLNDSRVRLQSPYGLVNAKGDMTLLSFEDIEAAFTIEPGRYSFGALKVNGGGDIKARIRPGENQVTAALNFTDIAHPLAQLSSASVKGDVTFDLVDGQSHVSGTVTLNFAELQSDTVVAQDGRLDWDGSFSVRPDSAAIREADGKWAGNIGRMTYSDAAGRTQLARALTLNEAMSAAPVTTHFADGLTQTVKRLLENSDVSGEGEFLRYEDKVEVKLTAPLTVRSGETQVVLRPLNNMIFYDYNRASDAIDVAANVALSAPRSVRLEGMTLQARSPNGLSISDVSGFQARAIISEEWSANSPEGAVRLAPISVQTRYENTAQKREMRAVLEAVDYDGPLPGGYATGVKTQGTLVLDLKGEGLTTRFIPSGNKQITAARFDTPTGWTARDAALNLVSETPFYTRGANPSQAALSARLEAVTTLLVERETGRKLDMTLSAVDVSTAINGQIQDWTLELFGAEVKTDDFGGPGTVVGAETARLEATLVPETAPQIELQTEVARVRTDQISTKNMPLVLKGTPTEFHLDFGGDSYASAGKVVLIGQNLPQLPLRGGLDYVDGLIVGKAYTVLPKAEGADIDVSFRLKNGEGSANIDIPQLVFTPKGLQPQSLVPALQGKIANVEGSVSANIDIVISPDKPMTSSGRAKLNDLDFGTLPGPFRGVNTDIEFTSVFPLVSSGVQRLTLDSFNPGVDLIDGVIEYELVEGGVEILSAKWPLANGFITLDPTVWKFDAEENRVVLRIDDVSVGAFLGEAGGGGLTVTGDVVGVIPVVVAGVDVRIDQGRLAVENGGVIQYRSQELTSVVDLIPEKYVTLQDYQQYQEFRKNEDLGENVGKDLAFTALRNFEYKSLSAKLDGPLDGEIEVNVGFIGRNPKILAGTEFDFNVTVIGELVNLVRGLKPDSSIERLKGYMDLEDTLSEEGETP